MSRPWWRGAVFYQIYVRSFADSNNDGIGDLPGITARLAYVRDLGADAISRRFIPHRRKITATTSPITSTSTASTEHCRTSTSSWLARTSWG